ncbi:MAG TPA: V-type ATPase subunit, partial [Spirochaetia bacterium]|nr:V-type ATPase subunit [Spirochaetia bacterium]
MAGQVGRYAYINAKLRARLSTMLTEEFFERAERTGTLSEAMSLFRETEYREVAELYDRTGDLKSVELELLKLQIEVQSDIRRQTEGSVANVIFALELRFEIGVLKHALRLWFDRVVRGRAVEERLPYLYRGPICTPLELDAIVGAPNLDQIADILKKTPYSAIVTGVSAAVEATGTLFPLEAALDRYFFHKLLETIEQLDLQDRGVARRLVGVQIDLENIGRLVRFKEAYKLDREQIASNLIPQGRRMSPKVVDSVLGADSSATRVAEIVGEDYPELQPMLAASRAS